MELTDIDYSSLDYTAPISESLICPICRLIFNAPVQTSCGHTFCKKCITTALCISATCPVDRTPILLDSLDPASRVIVNIVDELLVYCINREQGCGAVVQRSQLDWHIRKICEFVSVPCLISDCAETSFRGESEEGVCRHRKTRCEHCDVEIEEVDVARHLDLCAALSHQCRSCSEEFSAGDYVMHIETCGETLVTCIGSEFGCGWTDKRKLSESHMSGCPIAKMVPYLQTQESKIVQLATQNRALKAELELVRAERFDPIVTERDREYLFFEAAHLRNDFEQLSVTVSSLETKQSHVIMNETLRTKEELQVMRQALNSLRMQWHHWVMNSRPTNTETSRHENGASVSGTITPVRQSLPVARRLSDTTRQNVKL